MRRKNKRSQVLDICGTAVILPTGFSYLHLMGQCWPKLFGSESDNNNKSPPVDLASGNVHLITTIPSWEEKLLEASRDGKIVVANFSQSWSNPCRVIAPAYCELADKYPSMIFLTVDVDELAEFSSSWDIKATPTFFFLKDGRQLDKFVGAEKESLQEKTAAVADSATSCGAPSGVAVAQYPSHISIPFVHKSPYLSANIPAMADETRAVFSALDSAKTRLYHFKAVFVAGMTFFTIAYDLFSITAVTKLIYDPSKHYLWKPTLVNMDAITDLALCGTLAGKLFFRCLGDKLGRKKVYGITLVTMVGSAIASGLSFVSTAQCGITIQCFSWFWLGFGIGGDHPLSAVIISDYANQKPQGAFSMDGMGILVAVAVAMIASRMFLAYLPS
ncbi:hypothetical protein F0562_031472 [Nyssa sinensis]|uniref:Thioredoxin domain-containing protein n=1 Tax=Nyssa sinensis TaxID=561372 RepID=A0A5J5AS86_9ASTE|nr:hypothetical protein F0562_031472 [Nyssa sinensis]